MGVYLQYPEKNRPNKQSCIDSTWHTCHRSMQWHVYMYISGSKRFSALSDT